MVIGYHSSRKCPQQHRQIQNHRLQNDASPSATRYSCIIAVTDQQHYTVILPARSLSCFRAKDRPPGKSSPVHLDAKFSDGDRDRDSCREPPLLILLFRPPLLATCRYTGQAGIGEELSRFQDDSFHHPTKNPRCSKNLPYQPARAEPTLPWVDELLLPVLDSRVCREEKVTASSPNYYSIGHDQRGGVSACI